jgi:hypothetical protein
MDDPPIVRVLHGVAKRDGQLDPLVDGQCLSPAVLGDRRSADELHHQMGWRCLVAGVEREDLRDSRMLQLAEQVGFARKSLQELRMPVAAPQHFDRDRALGSVLLRRVDDAHAARADRSQHEERTERRPGCQRSIDCGRIQAGEARRVKEAFVRDVKRLEQGVDFSSERSIGATARV